MDATLLLCDAAQEVGGKLYILGGGWSVRKANIAAPMAIAIKVSVPWDQANQPHKVVLTLLDGDGNPVDLGEGPLQVEGSLEVGRPPGMKPGTPLDAPIVANWPAIALEPNSYVWELEIDGTQMARAPFVAIA